MKTKYLLFIGIFLFTISLRTLAVNEQVMQSVWVNEAIISTYTYDYKNVLERHKEIAEYYTAKAWTAYTNALLASNLLEDVKKNKYAVSAVATFPPEIKQLRSDIWEAYLPIIVAYKSPKNTQKQSLRVTIQFKKTNSQDEGVRGLAIISIKAEEEKGPCICEPQKK